MRMNSVHESDRRKFPRFPIQIPFSLAVADTPQDKSCDATVLNVSVNGVCCTVDHFFPLFDRVLLTFVLPNEHDTRQHLVSYCEGIVVRIEPEGERLDCSEYEMAVYFNNLSQPERNLLQSLIVSYAEA